MSKFSVDYAKLDESVNQKQYKLADVKHRLETVGFDLVRFSDGDVEQLWQVQSGEDGDYIVSLYSDSDGEIKQAKKLDWKVVANKTGSDINFFYKGEPIVKVAAAKLGLDSNEASSVQRYLPARLADNKALVATLLKELDVTTRAHVTRKFPELA